MTHDELYLDITGHNITDIYLTGVIVAIITITLIVLLRFNKRQRKHITKKDVETELYQSIFIFLLILIAFTYYAEHVRTFHGDCTKKPEIVRSGYTLIIEPRKVCK